MNSKGAADILGLPEEMLVEHGSHAVDFRGEALTFKATTAGVLARLQHCLVSSFLPFYLFLINLKLI